ncbi:actin depolymerizing protein [Astrocystis sublimbata]|nr:actin depolymerizing protein [Astrocystis sublimbata]
MQSGISASQELVSQFNTLLTDTSQFGLVITIASEALTPVASLPRSSPDFDSNLAQLSAHLQPDQPVYVLLRRFDDAPYLVAVTYVPDVAKVRQKMLFASTRLTLVRELGTEHFRETIFASNAEELTPQGFQKHDRHNALDAPLTEEERTLGDVKRAEAETGGTGTRQIHMSSTMNMPVKQDALDALTELGSGGGRGLVMLKINAQDESVELVPDSTSPTSLSEAVGAISTSEPRFTFYRYRAENDNKDVILFFYTNPATGGSKAVKNRMIYPLQKRAVLTMAEKECACTAEKKFEVEDPSEITEETVLEELFPKVETKTAFRRPKRPGR